VKVGARERDGLELVIAGAGGFGRTVLQFALDEGLRVAGFVDDRPDALDGFDVAARVLGTPEMLAPLPSWRLIVAVGDPTARQAMTDRLARVDVPYLTLVHPLAYVALSARLGVGCIVGPFAFIGPDAVVADHVAVNAHGYVDHDVRLGAWSYVGPRATISGFAELGDCVSVGAGATSAYGQKIAGNSRLRPGSVTAP
jgi:sugar O-acyltransferase (sialic acid O-acetyltransferase NeuD family)